MTRQFTPLLRGQTLPIPTALLVGSHEVPASGNHTISPEPKATYFLNSI